MEREKELRWVGSSHQDLLEFPKRARRDAGFQLGKVQNGLDPDDWKPFSRVGPGVREVRIRDSAGAYRVMYVANFAEAVYVLHCFHKKSQTTSRADKEIATRRYQALVNSRRQ